MKIHQTFSNCLFQPLSPHPQFPSKYSFILYSSPALEYPQHLKAKIKTNLFSRRFVSLRTTRKHKFSIITISFRYSFSVFLITFVEFFSSFLHISLNFSYFLTSQNRCTEWNQIRGIFVTWSQQLFSAFGPKLASHFTYYYDSKKTVVNYFADLYLQQSEK